LTDAPPFDPNLLEAVGPKQDISLIILWNVEKKGWAMLLGNSILFFSFFLSEFPL